MRTRSPARIVVLCPHPEGRAPAQRLKYEQYFPSWRKAGFEVDVRPFWSDATSSILYQRGHMLGKAAGVARGYLRRLRDVRDARRADLVYLFLEAAPLGPPLFERLIARAGVPIVYDIDDLVYLPHSSPANPFMRWLRGNTEPKFEELARIARHVIVTTEHLQRFVLGQNSHVTRIPPTLDTTRFVPRPHRDRTEGVVIGWTGSPSTSPYLHLLDDVFRELQRADDVSIRVIGDPSFQIPDVSLRVLPWQLDSEIQDLREMDIGVYPLPGNEWDKGKSGGKTRVYMALGIPTVAERLPTNREIIDDGRNGLLASTPEEWLSALRKLIHDPGLRRQLGDAGRATIVERYSVAVTEPVYLRVLRSALGSSARSSTQDHTDVPRTTPR